tara:strand:+ start:1070 stop:2149 length:1080 start_codon:yes stop_codon:yes gene_type:complete
MAKAKISTELASAKHPTLGFGVPASSDPHHFKVIIPKANSSKIEVREYLGLQAQSEELSVIDRVILDRPCWTAIRAEVQRAFNARLKSYGLKTSSWQVGENVVDRLLGKELCVLAWAVEGMDIDNIPVAIRNWLALQPEERWWLFGMTAMSTGGIEDRDVGWRIALRHALGDIVQTEQVERSQTSNTTSGVLLKSADTKPQTSDDESTKLPIPSDIKEPPPTFEVSVTQDDVKPQPSNDLNHQKKSTENDLFLFEAKQAKAAGHPVGEMSKPEFMVTKGSTANIAQAKSLRPAIRELRQKLVDDGVLVKDGDIYSFTCEYQFKSPSAAACVIAGNPRSGMDAWRDLKGRSLKELGFGKK